MSSYKSPERKRKEKIRKRDRKYYTKLHVCQSCGKACDATQIHHLKYDSDGYDPKNFVEVCPKCHADLHGFNYKE